MFLIFVTIKMTTVREQMNAMKTMTEMSRDPKITKAMLAKKASEYLSNYFELEAAYEACKQDQSNKKITEYVTALEKENMQLRERLKKKINEKTLYVTALLAENQKLKKDLKQVMRVRSLPNVLKDEKNLPDVLPPNTPRKMICQDRCHQQLLRNN